MSALVTKVQITQYNVTLTEAQASWLVALLDHVDYDSMANVQGLDRTYNTLSESLDETGDTYKVSVTTGTFSGEPTIRIDPSKEN